MIPAELKGAEIIAEQRIAAAVLIVDRIVGSRALLVNKATGHPVGWAEISLIPGGN